MTIGHFPERRVVVMLTQPVPFSRRPTRTRRPPDRSPTAAGTASLLETVVVAVAARAPKRPPPPPPPPSTCRPRRRRSRPGPASPSVAVASPIGRPRRPPSACRHQATGRPRGRSSLPRRSPVSDRRRRRPRSPVRLHGRGVLAAPAAAPTADHNDAVLERAGSSPWPHARRTRRRRRHRGSSPPSSAVAAAVEAAHGAHQVWPPSGPGFGRTRVRPAPPSATSRHRRATRLWPPRHRTIERLARSSTAIVAEPRPPTPPAASVDRPAPPSAHAARRR